MKKYTILVSYGEKEIEYVCHIEVEDLNIKEIEKQLENASIDYTVLAAFEGWIKPIYSGFYLPEITKGLPKKNEE